MNPADTGYEALGNYLPQSTPSSEIVLMETQHAEKRKEQRFPVEPGSKLKLQCRGNFLRATAIDVSVSGILLECAGPIRLVPGDPVACEIDYGDQESFEVRDASVGTVIRIHAPYIAVGFTGDLFSRLRQGT